ncbi:YdeI/OmpD-associated family protein [Litorihabitans aurantiacus]|uniref:DUF1905 domain-containing protein n=1 Tax=Litorihabitans aurantiacus TaxID=1930061 RepID=A0AA37XG39_9MICO|nr:YdeI/OmpD-associated family protein [Litorihabitans aurantiacus]GMA32464.1 hypothetical protein GCM10025875_24560 [Litorihabitans aurantiacus]
MTAQTFSSKVHQTGNNTGIEIPATVVEALGAGRRAPVVITVNGYTYSSTIGVMGGRHLVPLSAAHRRESGLAGGDAIEVTITHDAAPREVEVPHDLADALAAVDGARAAFDALSPSRRKAHVTAVEGAKAAATRSRRIEAVITALER